MNKLPKWTLTGGLPASNDHESATCLEQTYKVYSKVQELITSYNEFTTKVNKEIEEHESKYEGDMEEFTISLRQEFQDFMDVTDLKIAELETLIGAGSNVEERFGEINTELEGINESIDELNENVNELNENAVKKQEVGRYVDEVLDTLTIPEFDVVGYEFNSTNYNMASKSSHISAVNKADYSYQKLIQDNYALIEALVRRCNGLNTGISTIGPIVKSLVERVTALENK